MEYNPYVGKNPNNFVKDFFEARAVAEQRAREREQYNLDKTNRENLINAIKSGNKEEIDAALASYSPADYINRQQKLADLQDQKDWQLKMADIAHQRDLEKLGIANSNAINLAHLKAELGRISNGYPGMNNPFDKKRLETRAKNMDENIANSQSLIDTYNKAEALLNKNSFDTGGISDILAPVTTRFNKDAADFQAEVNKIVPTMRPAGSGSTSDRDMAIFEKATFGFDKPKQTNLNIIKGRRAVEENNIAKEELLAEYVTSGMGTLSDFDKEWRRYLNANPIFGDDEGNTLNKNRVSAYDWFSGKQRALDPRVQQALDAGYSMDEINAFLGR